MRKPVRTNPFAEEEIGRYGGQYRDESERVAERFFDEVSASLELLSQYPQIDEIVPGARVRRTARRVPLRHFPFFIVYRDLPDYVEIMALAHTSRRPNYWRDRFH